MTTAKAVAALLREGEEAIRQSLTFAKAVTGEEKEDPSDLDSDFEELDEAREESDAANEEQESDEDDQDGDDGDQDEDDGDDGDHDEDDGDDDMEEAFAKAYEDVDATPLLEALDARLTEQSEMLGQLIAQNTTLAKAVQGLQSQNATLAKAVQSNAEATLTFAKAQQGVADLPLTPKSRTAPTVTVPTRAPGAPATDANAVMAKAEQAVYEGKMPASQMSLLNTLANTHGMDAALEQFPPAFREMLTQK